MEICLKFVEICKNYKLIFLLYLYPFRSITPEWRVIPLKIGVFEIFRFLQKFFFAEFYKTNHRKFRSGKDFYNTSHSNIHEITPITSSHWYYSSVLEIFLRDRFAWGDFLSVDEPLRVLQKVNLAFCRTVKNSYTHKNGILVYYFCPFCYL